MPKATTPGAAERQARRHNPLAEEYSPSSPTFKQRQPKRKAGRTDEDVDAYVDSKASKRILKIGKDLVEEEQDERRQEEPNPAFAFDSRFPADQDQPGDDVTYGDEDDAWGDDDEVVYEEVEVDPNDQAIFDKFNSAGPGDTQLNKSLKGLMSEQPDENRGTEVQEQPTNLTDLILEKIAAYEAANGSGDGIAADPDLDFGPEDDMEEEIPPKVIEVYTQIGQLMSRHRSGPLPKPFKILPTLPPHQIPILLDVTNPGEWTPHAHLASVRLFISAKPNVATPYLREILLPRIRDDISETKKLSMHLFNALKKALYKPACFFKGILFPLVDGTDDRGDCTLREAHILGGVLTRVSVPVLHSAAALLRLCDIAAERFSTRVDDGAAGAVNTFIRVLLNKRYALPYKVIDALVFHFDRYRALKTAEQTDARNGDVSMSGTAQVDSRPIGLKLPVLWHQSFLVFAQRYRNDIAEDQRELLLDTVNAVGHPQMGPEIRRELLEGRGRGRDAAKQQPDAGMVLDGDDTMKDA